MDRHPEAQSYAQDLNEKIQIIEQCFDQIRANLPLCHISSYPAEIQFWSHIERAAGELKVLNALSKKSDGSFEGQGQSRSALYYARSDYGQDARGYRG